MWREVTQPKAEHVGCCTVRFQETSTASRDTGHHGSCSARGPSGTAISDPLQRWNAALTVPYSKYRAIKD